MFNANNKQMFKFNMDDPGDLWQLKQKSPHIKWVAATERFTSNRKGMYQYVSAVPGIFFKYSMYAGFGVLKYKTLLKKQFSVCGGSCLVQTGMFTPKIHIPQDPLHIKQPSSREAVFSLCCDIKKNKGANN